jgi:hypothetical protein
MTPAERAALARVYREGHLHAHAIAQRIADVHYEVRGGGVTYCCISLDNGFQVHAEAHCAPGRPFNPALGQRVAFQNAFLRLEPFFAFARDEARFWLNGGVRLRPDSFISNESISDGQPSTAPAL